MKSISINAFAIACSFAMVTATARPAAADVYSVDPAHTYVIFKVKHLGVGYSYGLFRKTKGSFDTTAGKINIEIDAKSLYTADKKRDDHLSGPDFFNTKQFPKITFNSTKVETKGKQIMVTGDLTIKGKTKSVSFTMEKTGEGKDPWGNYREGYEGTMTINRMDFGVDYMPGGVSKEVQLTVSVEGIRKK